ncbi:PepSY domain-containing protein [Alkalihalobacillus sp. R86527]|uniref:PepSY domain-containing protein n=1 Tax=Alkalihalobacillus sp. R86527 TaxID=3093863 RepID=UPI003672631A
MKKKLIIFGVSGAIVLGGGFGVNALANNSEDWNNESVKLSQEDAEKAAKQEVQGLKIEEVEKDKEGKRFVYEVEGTNEDGKEVEVEIDANSGEVISSELDDDSEETEQAEDVKISKEKAEEVAKKEGKGEIIEVELDGGHYEVKMKDGKKEYEVKVNGQTGEVMEENSAQEQ